MQHVRHSVRNVAILAALAVASSAAAARGAPPRPIEFHGGSVAFIAGIHWGGGSFRWGGRKIDIRVNGLNVGAIGADRYEAVGTVYHLYKPADIEGVYGAVNASATAGSGRGEIDMKNGKGVEIRVRARTQGLKLSLAPSGVEIHLAH